MINAIECNKPVHISRTVMRGEDSDTYEAKLIKFKVQYIKQEYPIAPAMDEYILYTTLIEVSEFNLISIN